MEIRKKWKVHLSWGFMARKKSLIEASSRRRHFGSLPRQVKPCRGAFHNIQQLFVRRAGVLREFSLNILTLRHLLLFLGINQQSTSRLDQMMSERLHHHNLAAHPRSLPTRVKGKAPSQTHRLDPPASPTISFSSVPRQRWVLNRGKQTAAPLSSKRGTGESGASS